MSAELTLDEAYAACRAIARREARNFYYAFVALPATRRNAICAIYAFMRHADDLADDETQSREERRRRLAEWQSAWRAACENGKTTDPVFLAVRDATLRFSVPLSVLDDLIAGTAMDLEHDSAGATQTLAAFDDLYRYCYFVASVVGLVCIRIFGYSNPRAEKLAEETGVAFQLTNILRDVAEDAARNRIYLPLDALEAHELSPENILDHSSAPPSAKEKALLRSIARRAEIYYASARKLMPLIDRESRPALRVLVSIYRALLSRIRRADYDVFSRRIRVPAWQKLLILSLGLASVLWRKLTV